MRQMLIKTRRVLFNNENYQRSLYLHIFIDTTQICQLEEAKAQNKYQKQMLANVSHEFRTPLNAMKMSLTLMKDTINKQNEKFLKIALSSTTIL